LPGGGGLVVPITGELGSLEEPAIGLPYGGFTPQQIGTAYGIDQVAFGSSTGNGSGQTIAIVGKMSSSQFCLLFQVRGLLMFFLSQKPRSQSRSCAWAGYILDRIFFSRLRRRQRCRVCIASANGTSRHLTATHDSIAIGGQRTPIEPRSRISIHSHRLDETRPDQLPIFSTAVEKYFDL
jgi:hypothetical protein